MNTAATQSMQSVLLSSVASPNTSLEPIKRPQDDASKEYHMVLLAIYSMVLLTGTISFSLMMHIMKSSSTSVTSVAVLNLIFTHFVFLLTVPFRIYYYTNHEWNLGPTWCRVVSVMIHTHMYMSFIFYVIILITRLMTFYRKTRPVAQFRGIHALIVSAVVWIVVLVVVPIIVVYKYGQKKNKDKDYDKRCFKFGESINERPALMFNYIISPVIIVVATVLTALQANVLKVLYKKHQKGCTSQQEFWAQLKSLFFAVIMVVCFVPYHIFRIVYLGNVELESINEVFLSLTTLNCLDMLTFLGNKTCYMCFLWRAA